MEKTLVIFNGFYLPHLGGVERYTAGMVSELKKYYRVIIVTSNDSRQKSYEKKDGIEIYRLDAHILCNSRLPILKHTVTNRKILNELRALNITNIICNTRYYGITLMGLKLAREKNLTPIIIDHSSDYIMKPYERFMLKRIRKYSPKYYAVSLVTANWLKAIGIKTEGIFYNSIEPQKNFTKSKSEAVRLIYAGRLMKEKGVNYILDSYAMLNKKYKLSLKIVGGGPLAEEIRKKGLSGMTFLGPLEHDRVLEEFRASDIFLFPTIYPEGFPTTILEAAGSKCAIIATDRGGTKELITNGKVGVLLKNPDELTEELEKLIIDKSRLRSIQEEAFKKVNEDFVWPKTVKIMRRELEKYEQKN